ncbi:hypothetical protein CTI12_AA041200 [Artemisia annua]|uniref:Uncharacterized protein n=1 Tax=Artemisia annua TaxID=35608 RepID=A0A2U1PAP7_ARTAN|nr:hypothetical protein CTI12_AA041200 [Artemisia annua]
MPRSSRSKSHKHKDIDDNNNGDVEIRVSSEKRKLNNVSDNVNEVSVKRRKERGSGSDRWNGDEEKCEIVDIIDDVVVEESKSRSSRGEKRLEKETKSKSRDEEESRNIDLEKELKKRIKRRESYNDLKESDERILSSKSARADDIKQGEDKLGEIGERVSKSRDFKHRPEIEKDNKPHGDKHREDGERDRQREDKHREDGNRYKNERYREDADRDHRHKIWRPREDTDREKRARDPKRLKDDSDRKINNHGESSMYDDRSARYKDNKDRKRDNNSKEELTDYRTRNIKNQYSESEKRSTSDAKIDQISSERGRPASRRSSPDGKFYPSRDHHRVSKQEETKYRDYVHEERKSDKVPPRTLEKICQKDGNVIDGISLERHPRSDACSSPVVDICHISPSSTSNERRHSNRPDVRRNLDAEEIGSRSVRSKDAKEYSDNHLGIGSSEDDRSKINNHNRRPSGDHNMGRPQNNWNNYPNWSRSPLPNSGYIPFHPVPPPIFNPVMQQFMPPMFGRPPMNMNNGGMPFPGHGNPGVWGNQVRESIPPPLPLHGWEPNNLGFNGSHGFANWDHMRPQLNNQVWESNADMPSASQKTDHLVQGPTDEVLSGETEPQIENEENQPVVNTLEVMKVADQVSIAWKEDAAHISQFYLSKIDISKDLTEPELYDQCKSMLNSDLASVSDESDCKILFLEEGPEADSSNGASLYGPIDDSVFEKAMAFYTKQKEQSGATNQEGVFKGPESIAAPDQEKSSPVDDGKLVEEVLEDPVVVVKKEDDELQNQKFDIDPMSEDIVGNNNPEKSGETPEKMDMEVDHPIENQDKESTPPSVGVCEVKFKAKDISNDCNGSMELDKLGGGDSVLLLTNVSTTESVESASVNLSRIHHHSPESTH